MCLVIDIVCSEDSDEGHESGVDKDYCFIGTRSWLQFGTRLCLATELYRRFVPCFG